ncbi:hypothetical protein BU24DRAFT_417565 [Aaosphaeria arxii CBS 175.79]|uniref:Uncharacterized protein n=1 Tax=Aaosphaeria arxii CBS 175.79 TaxID=1450172 RepID=A0A6A5YA74_9PLEO|nr:uncharacterized protein BU24DRAFT_417565 [Aaosphaeria arxii CBS 175.79]KAF2021917.1 hypothetical protein BU24DRAFT_417565 [Aaosphaeria arxii CBS 175.79]
MTSDQETLLRAELQFRWKDLANDFEDGKKVTVDFLECSKKAGDTKYFFRDCKEIHFKDPTRGKTIWLKEGGGEIIVPPKVDILVLGGAWKEEFI